MLYWNSFEMMEILLESHDTFESSPVESHVPQKILVHLSPLPLQLWAQNWFPPLFWKTFLSDMTHSME